MTLDPAGLEAAAKLARSCTPTAREDARLAEQIVRAYLAAAPDTGRSVLMHVPVTPTTENPYRGRAHRVNRRAWDEGFAAGRAAATPDPPDGSRVAVTDAEFENGVRCVTMPCCAFTFDADHTDQDGKTYTCPLCSPAASPTAPPPPRTLSEIAAGVPPPGGRDWKTPWDAEGDT